MVTLAQRLEFLRTQHGMTRPGLSAALGFPRNAIEKFETGRQTPTKDQQEKICAYFGVSSFYLKGESDDPTRQDNWMNAALSGVEEEPVVRPRPAPVKKPVVQTANDGNGSLVQSFLNNKAFQETVRTMVLETLRTPEGQELLSQIVRKEIGKQK